MVAQAEQPQTDRRDDKLIPLEEVAEAYGIKRATVWNWVEAKRIPAPVITRHRYTRWSNNAIQDHIDKLKRGETEEAAS